MYFSSKGYLLLTILLFVLQYLHVNDTERPGGNLIFAIVQPSFNTSSVTYRIVGDNSSVSAVFDALVANCSVANSTSAKQAFTPSPSTWPLPEQVIQYYRASSFALSLDGYNNTAALSSNMPASNSSAPVPLSQDTPLPSGLNTTFLQCLNTTIAASVPLVDNPSHKLPAGEIVQLVFYGIAGLFILAGLAFQLKECYKKRKERKAKSVESPRLIGVGD